MIKVNRVYECPMCGERESVGPLEIPNPGNLGQKLSEIWSTSYDDGHWHKCYTKAGLNIDMWGLCKFVGIRGIDSENKKEKESE